MLKQYTPPYITILILTSIINILFSTYFVSFFLAGVVFKIFTISLKEEYNYIFILSIITFLIIEHTQGVKFFSLTIISLLVYYLIIPRLKHLFSSHFIGDFLYILSFYLLFYLSVQVYALFDVSLLMVFVVNLVIDLVVVGFIL